MIDRSETDANEILANAAITKFLDYYVDPNRPFDYAVMVSGPWGSGKTHLVKGFLESRRAIKPLYVTLNGITSVEQIGQEFYRQLHPVLSSRGMRIAGAIVQAVAKGALKMDFNQGESGTVNLSLPDIDLTKELGNPGERLLVFDDLERCKMPVSEVLGYINGFVEHDGLKVMILANEDEIRAHLEPRYDKIREKLIGQTLTVSAPASEAFAAFLGELSDKATQGFLKRHKNAVLALHAQGGCGNLRTLKHAMWDFEKIGCQLEHRHWAKEDSVLKLLKGTMVVTMESRAGGMNETDLASLIGNRLGRLMLAQARQEKSKIDEIDERYPQVNFDDVLLNAEMLAAILLRGEMDAPALLKALDLTRDYAKPDEQPLWMQAYQIFNADDAACEDIAEKIESGFTDREFTTRGELMHIMGIRLWFAEIGLITKIGDEIVAEGKAYIDDLAAAGRLETTLDSPWETGRHATYGGYQFVKSETAEYRAITSYYDEVADKVEKARLPGIARELLALLPKDPDAFLFDVAVNTVRQGPYWYVPVFASIPASEYAEAAFYAPADIQARAIEALHSRHDRHPDLSLRSERDWIPDVKTELEKLMVSAKPMTRYRLESLIARNLDPLLPDEKVGEGVAD